MKLDNKGWGTTEMFLLSGGLFIALIVAIFFISRLYGSLNIAVNNSPYFDLETKLSDAAKSYVVGNFINISEEHKYGYEFLRGAGYIDSLIDPNGNSCTGYVVVSQVDAINQYNAYISCPNYTTRNY